ncbi:MAG: sialidase family protein [Planctomycetota bacterium]|nr:sialidase family protein [Planctomycetota bacterium]
MRRILMCVAMVSLVCAQARAYQPTHAVASAPLAAQTKRFEPVDVFVGVAADPQSQYPIYRIPAIVRCHDQHETLLAFAEGRQASGDQSSNDLVLRTSADQGATWSPLRVIAEEGEASLNNPCALVLPVPGGPCRVVLMYQSYPKGVGEYEAKAVRDEHSVRSWMITSDDAGVTWSKPVDLTEQVIPPEASTAASGPGCGIWLEDGPRRGRLIMPLNCRIGKQWTVYAVFSDDDGATWKRGAVAESRTNGWPNEVQMVELAGGDVMLNCRLQGGKDRCRGVAVSRDGGEHWSPVSRDERLIDPVCMGALVRLRPADAVSQGVLAFSNPASASHRRGGVIRLSQDDGRTWPVSFPVTQVPDAGFAYSVLVPLSDQTLGCLYESDAPGVPIRFVRLGWDLSGAK